MARTLMRLDEARNALLDIARIEIVLTPETTREEMLTAYFEVFQRVQQEAAAALERIQPKESWE
ncbi:MAG: hypothetical protein ABI835_10925 [Chloroflexota bacterium]